MFHLSRKLLAASAVAGGTIVASAGTAFAGSYTVQPGDTLSAIGQTYGVSWETICAENSLADCNLIYVGQSLYIGPGPVAGTAPTLAADPAPAPSPAPAPRTTTATSSFEACVIQRESTGNPTAVNPVSGAAGLYQFLPSTWGGFEGYASAAGAPVSVQQQKFDQVYAADGTAPWSPYDGC